MGRRDGGLPCGGCQQFESAYLQLVNLADTKLYDSTQFFRFGSSIYDFSFMDIDKILWWKVRLRRRDSTAASKDEAQAFLPSPFSNISNITKSFINQSLDINDSVVLSGAHTLGYARCTIFRGRIYSDTNIDLTFAHSLQSFCPPFPINESDPRLAALDQTPAVFDTLY